MNPLTLFAQSQSDAISIEASAFEKLEKDFGEWYNRQRISLTDEQRKSYEEVVRPVMEWMCKNTHPHAYIVINQTIAEMTEGIHCISTTEFLDK